MTMINSQIEFELDTQSYVAKLGSYTLKTAFQKIISKKLEFYGQEALLRVFDENNMDITPLWFQENVIDSKLDYLIMSLHLSNYSLFSKGSLFINVTPMSLVELDVGLSELLINQCQELDVNFEEIILEITEVSIGNEEQLSENLKLAKRLVPIEGIKIALDDFSFSDLDKMRLEFLEPDIIKFDLKSNFVNVSKVRGFKGKSNAVGLIECVENQNAIDEYFGGFEFLQGFYIHRPEIYTDNYLPSY